MVKFSKKLETRIILILTITLILITTTLAQPPLPLEIYGSARVFNAPVSPGTTINAIDIEGNSCGQFTVTTSGVFGTLTCLGQNTKEEIRGAIENEIIRFRVGNFPASVLLGDTAESLGNLKWGSGKFEEVILVVPPLVCGDGFCDFYESCSTCPEDCGECITDDEGTAGDPGMQDPSLGDFDIPPLRPEPEIQRPEEECIEAWECTEWGPCLFEGIQTRVCVDNNECGTEEDKPETERECIYDEETEDISTEDPVVERPRVEAPVQIETCDLRLPILGLESIVFFLIFTIMVLGPLFFLKNKKKKIKKKKLEDVEELVAIFKIEHKIYTFLIIISVLSMIIYLYHYFFLLCPEVYHENLWLLLAFVLLSPIIINILLYLLKYSEKRKILMMKLLQDTHYKHLKYLVTLINKDLLKSEVEITNKIYSLNNKDEFSDVLANTQEIKKIYEDLLKLYSLYIDGKDSLKIEKDLRGQIIALDKNEKFKEAIEDYPELAALKDNISLLYDAYESKQELVSALKNIEKHYDEDALDEKIKDLQKNNKENENAENQEEREEQKNF